MDAAAAGRLPDDPGVTFRCRMGLGESLFIEGRNPGHWQARTSERYSHLSADPQLLAADRIGEAIEEAVAASEKVVDMRRGGRRVERGGSG